MKFDLVDSVLRREPDRIVTIKQVSLAEEYLGDHFPTFPVLPGVMMVEAMVQAARTLLAERSPDRLVLGEVRALKFGQFVAPGDALEVDVQIKEARPDGSFACRGTGVVRRRVDGDASESDDRETAVSGRFTMRPVRDSTCRATRGVEATTAGSSSDAAAGDSGHEPR